MSSSPLQAPQPSSTAAAQPSERYLIAFVIQGDDVFKITADNIIHTTGTADGPAFDAIAKLKAAAALLELTNRHKERPDELRKMARELAGEGMKLMARASSNFQPLPPEAAVQAGLGATAQEPENLAAQTAEFSEESQQATSSPALRPVPAPVAAPIAVLRASAPPPRPEEKALDEAAGLGSRIALIPS